MKSTNLRAYRGWPDQGTDAKLLALRGLSPSKIALSEIKAGGFGGVSVPFRAGAGAGELGEKGTAGTISGAEVRVPKHLQHHLELAMEPRRGRAERRESSHTPPAPPEPRRLPTPNLPQSPQQRGLSPSTAGEGRRRAP